MVSGSESPVQSDQEIILVLNYQALHLRRLDPHSKPWPRQGTREWPAWPSADPKRIFFAQKVSHCPCGGLAIMKEGGELLKHDKNSSGLTTREPARSSNAPYLLIAHANN